MNPLRSKLRFAHARRFALSTSFAVGLVAFSPGLGPGLRFGARLARAADAAEAQAKEMFRRAEVHFNLREFDRALELYTEAYRLKPLPGFLFNIAQCHRFSERYQDAAFSFRVYLERAPAAANRAEVEELIAQMEAKAAAAVAPSEPVTPPTPTTPPPEQAAGSQTEPAPVAPADQVPERAEPVPAAVSPWVWATGGLGLALLGTGVVTGQMASWRSERYRESPSGDLRDSGRTLVKVSIVTLAAGGAAVAAAGVLWWMGRRPEPGDAQVAVAPTPGGAVFAVTGGF